MNIHKHIVITAHGIRTFGEWQTRLEELAKSEVSAKCFHHNYNYFSLVAFIVPIFRWIEVRRFERALLRLIETEKPDRIDIVAHSFGTHIVGWALRRLSENNAVQVNTVILSGSVLRSDFDWQSLMPSTVRRVVNDCGTKDSVLILSQFLVLFTGMAGRIGFVGMQNEFFQNRFSEFGHSGYFNDAKNRPQDDYMRTHWVPLISGSDAIPRFHDRPRPTPASGILMWLINNLEPIKLLAYLLPFVSILFYLGYSNATLKLSEQRFSAVYDLAQAVENQIFSAGPNAQLDVEETDRQILNTVKYAVTLPLGRSNVVWLDDNPVNNEPERQSLEKFGTCFTLVEDGQSALALLEANPGYYSALISDFNRSDDPLSGYKLLDEMTIRSIDVPTIIYSFQFTEEQQQAAKERGALDQIRSPVALFDRTITAISKERAMSDKLSTIAGHYLGCPEGNPT